MAAPYKLESSSESAFQCLLEIQFSVFLGNTEADVTAFSHFHRGPSSRCCLGLGKWRCFRCGFVLEKHNEDRKPDYRSWLRLAPAYLQALAFALLSLEAPGCLLHPHPWLSMLLDGLLIPICFRISLYSSGIQLTISSNGTPRVPLLASVGRLSLLVD